MNINNVEFGQFDFFFNSPIHLWENLPVWDFKSFLLIHNYYYFIIIFILFLLW